MDSDTLMRFIYLAVILMAVGGSVFVSIRRAPGRSAQSFVIWVLLLPTAVSSCCSNAATLSSTAF